MSVIFLRYFLLWYGCAGNRCIHRMHPNGNAPKSYHAWRAEVPQSKGLGHHPAGIDHLEPPSTLLHLAVDPVRSHNDAAGSRIP